MNTERLLAVVKAVRDEIEIHTIEQDMRALASAVQNMVSSSAATYQQQVVEYRQRLYETLSESPSNEFSPAWRQILKEINGIYLLGIPLRDRIEDVFSYHQVTPVAVRDEIDVLWEEFNQFNSALNDFIKASKAFQLVDEALAEGECEIGILIPRVAVSNDLEHFAKELRSLNLHLGAICEACSGSREAFKIKTLSSSDFMVTIEAALPICASIAKIVNNLVGAYKGLLGIRKLRAELKEAGVPEENLQKIDEHANKVMDDKIQSITIELTENYSKVCKSKSRPDIEPSLKLALSGIASRIDRGFNIEVRVFEILHEEVGDKSVSRKRELIAEIKAAQPNMEYMHLEGVPILSIQEEPVGESRIEKVKRTK